MAPTDPPKSKLEKLKRKRQTIRGLTTKLLNKIKEKLETGGRNLEVLREHLDQLINKQNELTELNKEIEDNIEDLDDLETEITSSQEWQDEIISVKSKLKYVIENENADKKSVVIPKETEPRENKTYKNIKLPKLEIRRFNGEIEKWEEFWGQFSSAIHENKELSKIDKFNYLKSLVIDSAFTAIQGLSISESNYDIAIDTLKEKYGRKELIVSTHVNNLLKLTPVRRSYQLKELRKLYDDCKTQIRCLEALGIKLDSFGNLLYPILVQLIPEDIILEYNRTKSNKEWDVEKLLENLGLEIESRERCDLFKKKVDENYVKPENGKCYSDKNKQRETYHKFEKKYHRNPTTAAFNTSSKLQCIFCSLEHKSEDCSLTITERKQSLLRGGYCFNCFLKGHVIRRCKSKSLCTKPLCSNRKHNPLICELENETEKKNENNTKTVVTSVASFSPKNEVILQTALAYAENGSRSCKIRILFDLGSQTSFIEQGLSQKLQLKMIEEENISIFSFGSENPKPQIRKRVQLSIRNIYDSRNWVTIEALEIPCISATAIHGPNAEVIAYCEQNGIQISDSVEFHPPDTSVSLLLGSDVYWKIASGIVKRLPNDMVAMETKLGWVVSGSYQSMINNREKELNVMKILVQNTEEIENKNSSMQMEKFWNLENIGIIDEKPASEEENEVLEEFQRSIEFKENRYEVRLPWNDNKENLTDNFETAETRFKKLIHRFRKNSEFYENYKAVMTRHLEAGIIEKVNVNTKDISNTVKYYLPHQAVIREEKSTKLRIVFDASSSLPGSISLNDCLKSGPNLNPDLLSLLLKFRWNTIACTADIEQAFLQVSISPQDRDSVRFLWLKEDSDLYNNIQPEIHRFARVIFGATSSPFLLAATIKYHVKKYEEQYPEAFKILNSEMYVDDLISGTNTEENALKLQAHVIQIMQEIWKRKLKWDDLLPSDLKEDWQKWCKELPELERITIPRYYFQDGSVFAVENLQMHCFVDASKKAYGAVIYLRYLDSGGNAQVTFVTSKSRVAPVHEITLPRLELLSALIGARLQNYVRKHLKLPQDMKIFLWTDSMITRYWIQGCSKKLKTFVKNRVNEIRNLTDPMTWNYCPGTCNPADLMTRGENLNSLTENRLWWHGPKWLEDSEDTWPKEKIADSNTTDTEEDLKQTSSFFLGTDKNALFDVQKFSNLNEVLRITSWIFRFIHNVRKTDKLLGNLTAEELQAAENYWIKKTQENSFGKELSCLAESKEIYPTSKLLSLHPFLDEFGVLRLGGRLEFSDLSYEEKHPIILPDKEHFTELVIHRSHLRTGHSGVSGTLTDLRERFWVPKGRQRVKSFVFKCNLCRKFRTKPATQDMAKLPPDRVREAFPFEVTGLDYLGPLYVKEQDTVKKCYVLLFTCAVTRAVHLELTHDLSTPVFLQAFKKFIARRGLCKTVFSDNAKTFKKAKKDLELLHKCLENDKTQNYFATQGIKWKFIVEKAAWWGGFWERLVRSVKDILRKILGRSSLTFSELETVIIESEAILNSRPLTYVSSDEREFEPLTPGHFLIGRRLLSIPGSSTIPSSTSSQLLKRQKHQKILMDRIWNRWRKTYLVELRSAIQSRIIKHPVQIEKNSVVQIYEDKIPKMMWRVGIVNEVHSGRDGKPRSCTVRLPCGTILKRPVQLLYPLELSK